MADESSKLASPKQPTQLPATQILQDFLIEHKIELRLTAPQVRQIENGGILIEQPQIIAGYKQEAPITTNSINKH